MVTDMDMKQLDRLQ